MTDVERLLRAYIEQDTAGADPDPLAFLAQVEGADRAHLEAMIDAYLQRLPRAPFHAAAYRDSPASNVVEGLDRNMRAGSKRPSMPTPTATRLPQTWSKG